MLNEAIGAIIVLAVCVYFKWQLSYWKRKKIDGPPPLPIFGNMMDFVLMQRHFGFVYDDIYRYVYRIAKKKTKNN